MRRTFVDRSVTGLHEGKFVCEDYRMMINRRELRSTEDQAKCNRCEEVERSVVVSSTVYNSSLIFAPLFSPVKTRSRLGWISILLVADWVLSRLSSTKNQKVEYIRNVSRVCRNRAVETRNKSHRRHS